MFAYSSTKIRTDFANSTGIRSTIFCKRDSHFSAKKHLACCPNPFRHAVFICSVCSEEPNSTMPFFFTSPWCCENDPQDLRLMSQQFYTIIVFQDLATWMMNHWSSHRLATLALMAMLFKSLQVRLSLAKPKKKTSGNIQKPQVATVFSDFSTTLGENRKNLGFFFSKKNGRQVLPSLMSPRNSTELLMTTWPFQIG